MSRLSSRLTSGRMRTPRTTLKIDALAPIPRASGRTTVADSPLARLRERSANLRSCRRVIVVPLHVGCGIVYGIAPRFNILQRREGGDAVEGTLENGFGNRNGSGCSKA